MKRFYNKFIKDKVRNKLSKHPDYIDKDENIIFDRLWYLYEYEDVKLDNGDPFRHYINYGWKEGRNPSKSFNTNEYLESEPGLRERLISNGSDPLRYFHNDNKSFTRIDLRNLAEYVAKHPDNICDEKYKIFNEGWYLSVNFDVEAAGVDAFEHYVTHGWKEGRSPSPLFDTNVYLNSKSGMKHEILNRGVDPLFHYHQIGRYMVPTIFYNTLDGYYKSYIQNSKLIDYESNARSSTRSAAFVHCFYIDIAEKLIDACLEKGVDVYVSFVEGTKFKNLIKKYGERINYKIFENRGRDILPFVTGFKEEITRYDYALHLHTKKSLHYGEERNDWLNYCLEALISNLPFIESTFREHNDVDIIYPEPPDFVKDVMNWGWNYDRVNVLMQLLNRKLNQWEHNEFPAGSMFWFRVSKLKPIFDLHVSPYLFEKENGQIDGTLAHAYERLFGAYVLSNQRKLVPVRNIKSTIFDFNKIYSKDVEIKVSKQTKSTERYNTVLKKYYSELTPFTFAVAKSRKKRLNLLVPTVNPAHVFGGIDTALKFFFTLSKQLNYDLRIITCDANTPASAAKQYHSFSNYNLTYLCDEDPRQIVSAATRCGGDLSVREKDVFIATAWWTAIHLIEIVKYQKINFNVLNKHIYFIQDYEPHFYGWSTKSQLADKTYNQNWIKIYNTDLLFQYFKGRKKVTGDSHVISPQINESIARELNKLDGVKKEKIILLYGRPSAERNCNEILLQSVADWKSNNSNSAEWEVISVGEHYLDSTLEQLGISNPGKVGLKEYADLLARSYVGVSLMVSPHPSYPPIEMCFAGLKTYTNKYDNKTSGSIKCENLTFGLVDQVEIEKFLTASTIQYHSDSKFNYKIFENIFGDGKDIITVARDVSNQIK